MTEEKASVIQWHEQTHYECLDLPQDASLKEIKEAYKTKLLSSHPDKQVLNGATEASKTFNRDIIPRLKDAYRVLSDSKLREEYDAELLKLFNMNGIVDNGEGLDTYTLDDFEVVPREAEEAEDHWVRDCPRCLSTQSFELSESDLEQNATQVSDKSDAYELILQCNSCSLWIRVEFYEVQEE